MWQQAVNPLHSIAISALVASIPIIVLFALLITKKLPGHLAALSTLIVALIVATFAFKCPLA